MKKFSLHNLAVCLLLALPFASLNAEVRREKDGLAITFDSGVELALPLEGDWLLGLAQASKDGYPLTSSSTVMRPLVGRSMVTTVSYGRF